MAVKDKQAKPKFGLLPTILTFVVLIVFGVLAEFIGLFPASIVGLIITVSIFLFLYKNAKSTSLTPNEKLIASGSLLISIFLVLDALIFGFVYSQGGYTPQLLNVSFPTAQQASSIFNTSLFTSSGPFTFGNAGTGQLKVLADAKENYRLVSSPSSNITVSILQFNNHTDAVDYYDGWLSPSNTTTGNYNGLTYIIFNEYHFAIAYINNYGIKINLPSNINQTSTVNFLKKEADIINGNS